VKERRGAEGGGLGRKTGENQAREEGRMAGRREGEVEVGRRGKKRTSFCM